MRELLLLHHAVVAVHKWEEQNISIRLQKQGEVQDPSPTILLGDANTCCGLVQVPGTFLLIHHAFVVVHSVRAHLLHELLL